MTDSSSSRSRANALLTGTTGRTMSLALVLVLVGVLLRIACSDLPNFAPIAAIGLFAGYLLPRKSIAILIPIAIMIVSNIWFGGYDWPIMLSVLACYAAMPVAGMLLARKGRQRQTEIATCFRPGLYLTALGGSVLFFVVTNFAVWATHSQQSIWECYAAAVPFFRYTALSDIFFAFTFFAAYDALIFAIHQPSAVSANPDGEA